MGISLIRKTGTRVAAAYREAFSGLDRQVWSLALVLFVNRSGSMVLPFIALYTTERLGFNEVLSGLLIAIYGAGSILGSFLGGYLSGIIGAFRVQWISLLLSGIGFFVLSAITTPMGFAVTLFSISVVAEAFRPANFTMTTQICPRSQHKRALALNRLAINLGFTFGPAIGGFLATVSYTWLFALDGATCLIAALLMLMLFKIPPVKRADSIGSDEKGKGSSPWSDWNFVVFLALNFLSAIVFFQILSTYPLFLRDEYLLSEWQVGLLLGINTLVIVVFEMLLIRFVENYETIKTIGWGCFLSCLGFGLLVFGHGFWFAAFSVLVWTLGEMLAMPLATAFTAERSNDDNRGAYMGAFTISYSIAFVVGPVVGTLAYRYDHYLFWYLAMLIGVVVLIGFHWLSVRIRNQRIDQPEDSVLL